MIDVPLSGAHGFDRSCSIGALENKMTHLYPDVGLDEQKGVMATRQTIFMNIEVELVRNVQ
jgi:hypothetical protein